MKKEIQNNNLIMARTKNGGEINQAAGFGLHLAKALESVTSQENMFVKDKDSADLLKYEHFETQEAFEAAITNAIEDHFETHQEKDVPEFFIIPYCQGDKHPLENIDTWSKCVKNYYKKHALGDITCVTLTGKMQAYKHVDLVHMPSHALTAEDEALIKKMKDHGTELGKKIVVTEGILHHMTPLSIKQAHQSVKIQKFVKDNNLDNDGPKVVYALGGKTADGNITFDMDVAKQVIEQAKRMQTNGVQVIMTNGPRTPEDVTDFLYEQSLELGLPFVNFKPLAVTEDDKSNWIKYNGKHYDTFKQQSEEIGNLLPGIYGLSNIAAIHTSDTYAICETASCGIPSASFEIPITEKRADCHKLRNDLLRDKRAVDAEVLTTKHPAEVAAMIEQMPNPMQTVVDKAIVINEAKQKASDVTRAEVAKVQAFRLASYRLR